MWRRLGQCGLSSSVPGLCPRMPVAPLLPMRQTELSLGGLKTGFLKWKPDYDSAASEYGKAAVAFKNAKQFEQAKDACLREAVAHENNRALFHAAKAYEQAGMMLKEMQKLPEAVQLIEKASMMYLENGTPDTAAMALERAGKLIENVDPEKAVQLYQQTANVFENEERLRQAVELLGKASRLLVRGRRFDEAALSIQKEKNIYKEIENYPTCYKKTIAQVLVHLHRNDYVAAERCVRESYSIPGFNGSEDCAALEQLLEGYDQQDQDQVSEVCNSPLFKYMDNDNSRDHFYQSGSLHEYARKIVNVLLYGQLRALLPMFHSEGRTRERYRSQRQGKGNSREGPASKKWSIPEMMHLTSAHLITKGPEPSASCGPRRRGQYASLGATESLMP
ncbi:gamma-soluble NSF attachment protein isoform X1 [Equus przewalskii]|uniref:Gamma-soluble NSF attachment protein n=2 Tax=Equus przewalskii TaxID=9798 RepID=A0ABM4Q286_EQUPR